ncbi:thioredoxin family protein [Streptomyces sp. NPDC059761]|uniref:thioredoxin family protein n=1 Tax=Streptomyces sp. NPDC059761 TaxID=3346937 RepID=UPI00365E66FA
MLRGLVFAAIRIRDCESEESGLLRCQTCRTTAVSARSDDEEALVALKTVTDTSFDKEVLKNDRPVLLHFRMDGPESSRMMSAILEEFSAESAAVEFAELDMEKSPDTTSKYGVMSIPTLKLYRDGSVVHTVQGPKTKSQLHIELSKFM